MLAKAKRSGFNSSTYSGSGETSTTDFLSSARDTQIERPSYDGLKILKRNVQMGDARSHGEQH